MDRLQLVMVKKPSKLLKLVKPKSASVKEERFYQPGLDQTGTTRDLDHAGNEQARPVGENERLINDYLAGFSED